MARPLGLDSCCEVHDAYREDAKARTQSGHDLSKRGVHWEERVPHRMLHGCWSVLEVYFDWIGEDRVAEQADGEALDSKQER